jgi:hypothetical protein
VHSQRVNRRTIRKIPLSPTHTSLLLCLVRCMVLFTISDFRTIDRVRSDFQCLRVEEIRDIFSRVFVLVQDYPPRSFCLLCIMDSSHILFSFCKVHTFVLVSIYEYIPTTSKLFYCFFSIYHLLSTWFLVSFILRP